MDSEERRRRRRRERDEKRRRKGRPASNPGDAGKTGDDSGRAPEPAGAEPRGDKPRRKGRKGPPPHDALPEDGIDDRLLVVSSIIEERRMRRTEIVLGDHEFSSDKEMQEFLQSEQFQRELDEMNAKPTLEERAQDLAFEAMEATDHKAAIELATRSVALDPDCVDARLILAAEATDDPDEYLTLVERTVLAGERWLGDDFYDETIGRFWHAAVTRPYMRSMLVLGNTHCEQGDIDEATHVFEDMLELNPDDHQGARFFLVGLYLQKRDLERTRDLVRADPDDTSATFLWARVFERVLAGDDEGARNRIHNARQWCPKLEDYLLGREEAPDDLPLASARSEEGDATVALRMLRPAFETHPELKAWLEQAP